MAVGPVGAVIYTNQNTQAASVKQSDVQNRVDMQNLIASASANEKDKEIREVRPTEETYKIDPEKEHEKKKREEEDNMEERNTPQDTDNEDSKENEEENSLPTSHLDITV